MTAVTALSLPFQLLNSNLATATRCLDAYTNCRPPSQPTSKPTWRVFWRPNHFSSLQRLNRYTLGLPFQRRRFRLVLPSTWVKLLCLFTALTLSRCMTGTKSFRWCKTSQAKISFNVCRETELSLKCTMTSLRPLLPEPLPWLKAKSHHWIQTSR